MNARTTILHPGAVAPRLGVLLSHAFIAALFLALALYWPGAALLALLYCFAGYMTAYAGALLDDVWNENGDSPWLRGVGAALFGGGVLTLCTTGDFAAVLPLALGVWFVARGRNIWLALAGILLFTAGLLLISDAGAVRVPPLAVFGIHALSSGLMIVALAPRKKPVAAAPLVLVSR